MGVGTLLHTSSMGLLCLAHTQVPDLCLPVVIICTLSQLSSKLRQSATATPYNQPCLLQCALLVQQTFMNIERQTTTASQLNAVRQSGIWGGGIASQEI